MALKGPQARHSVGVALILTGAALGLAACSDQTSDGVAVESETGGVADESGIGALPLPQRLVFMSGHVEAGLALYRAGEVEAAAPHLLHPRSEMHSAERAGLEELGFDAAIFEGVSKALEEGKQASEIEPQLAAAEANLNDVRSQAGGDDAELIGFLMETAVAEYTVAVTNGVVTDPAEYQDAWGFVVVARKIAATVESERGEALRGALDEMAELWPEGAPIPPVEPAPVVQVSELAAKVALALPAS